MAHQEVHHKIHQPRGTGQPALQPGAEPEGRPELLAPASFKRSQRLPARLALGQGLQGGLGGQLPRQHRAVDAAPCQRVGESPGIADKQRTIVYPGEVIGAEVELPDQHSVHAAVRAPAPGDHGEAQEIVQHLLEGAPPLPEEVQPHAHAHIGAAFACGEDPAVAGDQVTSKVGLGHVIHHVKVVHIGPERHRPMRIGRFVPAQRTGNGRGGAVGGDDQRRPDLAPGPML